MALSCVSNQPVPAERIEALGAVDAARPLSSVTTLMAMVRLLEQNACPEFDKMRFADRMAELFLVENFQQKAASNIYLSLALLENSLERYDNAHSYIAQFLSMVPDDIRGLLMRLHFATALGKVDESGEIIRKLQHFDSEGKLNVGQQQTLGLYLEHP
jgi:tetratricopeptide (TPR) repeat protein